MKSLFLNLLASTAPFAKPIIKNVKGISSISDGLRRKLIANRNINSDLLYLKKEEGTEIHEIKLIEIEPFYYNSYKNKTISTFINEIELIEVDFFYYNYCGKKKSCFLIQEANLDFSTFVFYKRSTRLIENTKILGTNFISSESSNLAKYSNLDNKYGNSIGIEPVELWRNQLFNLLLPPSSKNQQSYLVDWDRITFMDGVISILFNGKNVRFEVENSKKEYNKLKKILKSDDFEKFRIELSFPDREPLRIIEDSISSHMFEVLEVENWLVNKDLGNIFYWDIITKNWNNEKITNYFRIRSKSSYLKHLCEICPPNLKIVPVRENRSYDSNESVSQEEAFLFPMRRQRYTYILWESVEENRATHIFRCHPDSYRVSLQRIYDYVVSPGVTNKRQRLHNSSLEYFYGSVAEYVGSANHVVGDVAAWKRRLAELTP